MRFGERTASAAMPAFESGNACCRARAIASSSLLASVRLVSRRSRAIPKNPHANHAARAFGGLKCRFEWCPQLGSVEMERRRHDTNEGVGATIQPYRLPDDGSVARKTPLPQAIPEHDHRIHEAVEMELQFIADVPLGGAAIHQ